MIIPTFQELQKQQHPVGHWSLYALLPINIFDPQISFSTMTVTLAPWEQHPRVKSKTRVHRTKSRLKAKVTAHDAVAQLAALTAVMTTLNSDELKESSKRPQAIANLPWLIRSPGDWHELDAWLERF
jgi:hypothetical protein